ncbi:hypothetical protein WYH_00002 [Croceibacterium atlanticum]|uniref:Uncharacterized protein n=1 Tax=Croceibacterium atlanticum TaxID=1267766 RepID=A0A0F7KNC9_9SPHN|nr:hypothetical protein WYH_00002 [Croceibacterium atlanticum]
MSAKPVQLRFQLVQMGQVADADRTAADLVFICRSDTAPRRADLALPGGRFAQPVQIAMQRQDQRAIIGNAEIFRLDRYALAFKPFNLRLQRPGVEHHAIADQRQGAGHNAAGQQAELVGRIAYHQRVAGIVAAWKRTTTSARLASQSTIFPCPRHPLGADHGNISHGYTPPPCQLDPDRPSTGLGERME